MQSELSLAAIIGVSVGWRWGVTSKLFICSFSFKSWLGTDQYHLTSTYPNLSYCKISLCNASEMKPYESPSLRGFAVRLQVVHPVTPDWYQELGKHLPGRKKSLCTISQSLNIPVAWQIAGLIREVRLLGHGVHRGSQTTSWWRCSWSLEPSLPRCIFTLFVSIMVRQGKWTSGEIRKLVFDQQKVSFKIFPL